MAANRTMNTRERFNKEPSRRSDTDLDYFMVLIASGEQRERVRSHHKIDTLWTLVGRSPPEGA